MISKMTPGKFWQADLLYMPPSCEGHKFILTITERLTSYVCALPLKALSVKHVCNALEVFLSICPPMEEMHTDHGRADFGENSPSFWKALVLDMKALYLIVARRREA